jgi:hypothetical protein
MVTIIVIHEIRRGYLIWYSFWNKNIEDEEYKKKIESFMAREAFVDKEQEFCLLHIEKEEK